MGSDFIEKATPSFKKSWDHGKVCLGTADLFTRQPTCSARTASAEIVGNAELQPGERIVVEASGTSLIARRGLTEVARIAKPPAELLAAVNASCGIAEGTVEHVHALARVAEISLC